MCLSSSLTFLLGCHCPFRRKFPNVKTVIEQRFIGWTLLPSWDSTSFLVGMTLALLFLLSTTPIRRGYFRINPLEWLAREWGHWISPPLLLQAVVWQLPPKLQTMVVTEEIDALKTMGLNPMRFVVIPKVWGNSHHQPR